MRTVRAARAQNYGGAEQVRIEDMSLREPQSGEVLVRVHAAGANPADWKIRAGFLQEMMPLLVPFTLGSDFSGVVQAVGPDVVDFEVGDEVFGQSAAWGGGSGAFAQLALARTGGVAKKPRSLSHAEAAGLPLAGVSALRALVQHLELARGERVLIHGGAGGIGSIAIQLAKHLGASVATTARTDDVAFVKALGAGLVVDYTRQMFETAVRDVDAVLDTVGGDTYVRSFKTLKRGGRIVSMLEQPCPELMKKFDAEASVLFTQVTSSSLTKLADLVDRGLLKVHIDRVFPLEQAATALVHLERGSPKGKVILQVA